MHGSFLLVVGFGKAVLEMLKGVKSVLDPHIVRGVMSVPYASSYEESDYQRVSHYPVRYVKRFTSRPD